MYKKHEGKYACFAVIDAPEGLLMVRDRFEYGDDAQLKWPGGEVRKDERPIDGLLRELDQEVGVDDISSSTPRLLAKINRHTHEWRLYYIKHPGLPMRDKLKKRGDEGEYVEILTPQEVLQFFVQDETRDSSLQETLWFHRRPALEAVAAIVDGREPRFID